MGDPVYCSHICRMTVKMHGNDAARVRSDFPFDVSRVYVHRVCTHIDQHRCRSTITHCIGGRDIRYRRDDHFIARLQVHCHHGQMQGGCSIVCCNGMLSTTECCERFL